MTSKFLQKINSVEWLLTDGATGTNLFNKGLRSGNAPELWNEKYPNKIVKLHKELVDAGSEIFLTNSFGSNALRLKLHSFENKAFELCKIPLKLLAVLQIVAIGQFLLLVLWVQQVKSCNLLEIFHIN